MERAGQQDGGCSSRRLLALAAFGLLAAACGRMQAYSGPAKSGAQTATVEGHGVSLKEVNGMPVSSLVSSVEIAAGQTEVALTVDAASFNLGDRTDGTLQLSLPAAAATRYIITAQRGASKICAYPADPRTGLPDFSRPAGCAGRR